MLRTTITKIRHVCMLAFIPRLFRGSIRQTTGNFEKLLLSSQKKAYISTSSSSGGESENERCQRIIDRVFAPNLPFTETVFTDIEPKAKRLTTLVSSQPPNTESNCDICRRLINQIFGDEGETIHSKTDVVKPQEVPRVEILQATTSKENEEKLTQKIEVIEETPLVEAHKPKIEGFNVLPKVLGGKERDIVTAREIVTLNFSKDKNIDDRLQGSVKKGETNFDELAKRCLDSPSGHIDERLLKEMEKLGVPPTSGRGSKKNLDENEFAQAEIMKKPRRPVEKTDLDLLSVERKEIQRININSQRPSEFVRKSIRNSMITCRDKSSKKKHFWTQSCDKRLASPYKHISSNEESQRLLEHMAAASISGNDTIKTTNDKTSRPLDKSNIKDINLVEHISVTIEEAPQVICKSGNRQYNFPTESPTNPEILKARSNEQIIQNLLQTRFEHLIYDKIKSLNLVEDNSNIISKINLQISDPNQTSNENIIKTAESKLEDPLLIRKHVIQSKGDKTIRESTKMETKNNVEPSNKTSPEFNPETYHYPKLQDIYNNYFKPERVTPAHILYSTTITADERSSLPHPGVVIREYIDLSVPPTETESLSVPSMTSSSLKLDDKTKQYQMKGEPTVYKSNTYDKYNEYLQNAQQPSVTKSNIYSRHEDIQEEANRLEAEAAEENRHLNDLYTTFLLREKQSTKEEHAVNQSNINNQYMDTQNIRQPSMDTNPDVNQNKINDQYMDTQNIPHPSMDTNPAVNQSQINEQYMDTQNIQHPSMDTNPAVNQSNISDQYMDTQNIQHPWMDTSPAVNQSNINKQYDDTQNIQQPSMDTEQAGDKSNLYHQNTHYSHSGSQLPNQEQTTADQSNMYNLQSGQQQLMHNQPIPNQNYVNNPYTNYMHSAQQPPMNQQQLIDQSNIYNQYNYIPKQNQHSLQAEPTLNKVDINKQQKQESEDKSEISDSKNVLGNKDEPVIVAETGRNQAPLPDNKLNATKDPVSNSFILSKKMVKPLIDKGTLAHVADESIQQELPPKEIPSLTTSPAETMTLSQLLKKVRERNRLEYCRNMSELSMQSATQVDPVIGECGKKPPCCPPPAPTCPPPAPKCPPPAPTCPPPAPKCPPPAPTCPPPAPKCPPPAPTCPPCPPPPKPPCPPPKPPCPTPCKPKCPPPCTPNPCAPKPPCPPVKKSPCDKFKCQCTSIRIQDVLELLIYNKPHFDIPQNVAFCLLSCALKNETKNSIASKIRKVCDIVFFTDIHGQKGTVPLDRVEYARTYHPWSPIPSWPIPKNIEKKKLVCPKDGCKTAPPRLNPSCSDINPCITFPKPNSLTKRSFSMIDYLFMALTKTCP